MQKRCLLAGVCQETNSDVEILLWCISSGVKEWRVMEMIVLELLDTTARRVVEAPLGLKLLQP
jgi:hypothetical protein